MKIYERLGDSGFHTSIISTFGIDFDAYESIALNRLRAAGCRNNVVIVDENMLVSALDGTSALPRMAGRQYSVSGASAAGVFHPKLFLQIGRRKGRLMVASANTTATGLAGNLELAGIIECTDKASDEQRIIASAWRYLAGRIDPEKHALARHIAWMQSRASWLRQAEVATGAVTLADGTTAAFLATGESTGVMNRFMALIGQDRIARLIVLSPYWDEDLAALRGLVSGLQPRESFLMIDGRRALFPGPALKHVPAAQLVDLASFGKGRFIHAKLIIASSADVDHVLFGSANCTVAALGTPTFAGANEEACLYRRLPTGEAIAALGLDAVLAEGQTLDGQTLPPLIAANDLEADETGRRNPGVFECAYDTLTWWAPNAAISSTARIELLDKHGAPVECVLEPMVGIVAGTSRFRIIGAKKRPDFARLCFPIGSESAIAVIARIESLIAAARDYESRAAKKAAERLDEETEIDLSLLEVLDDLEAAEATEVGAGSHHREGTQRAPEVAAPHKVLDYAAFLAGRTIRPERREMGRDSLAGTEQGFVRAFLNRVLTIDAASGEIEEEDESEDVKKALDLGDEIENAQAAVEGGASFQPPPETPPKPRTPEQLRKETEHRRAVQRRANREQLVAAVGVLDYRLRDRVLAGALTTQDLLRVRAMLLIVAAAGWPGAGGMRSVGGVVSPHSTRQVLPVMGDDDRWPRMLALILHSLFDGQNPPIRQLKIELIHDQMPDDVIECWATCFWAAQAAAVASTDDHSSPAFNRRLVPLLERVYRLTGLTNQELQSVPVLEVMDKIGNRYAARMGVDAAAVMAAHRRTVAGLAVAQH